MAATCHIIVENLKKLNFTPRAGNMDHCMEHGTCITVPNLIKIGQRLQKYGDLTVIRMASDHHHHVRLLEVVKRNQHRAVAQHNSLIVD